MMGSGRFTPASATNTARDWVPAGGFDQSSDGDTFSPFGVYLSSIVPPDKNAGEVTRRPVPNRGHARSLRSTGGPPRPAVLSPCALAEMAKSEKRLTATVLLSRVFMLSSQMVWFSSGRL